MYTVIISVTIYGSGLNSEQAFTLTALPQCEGFPFEADPVLFWTEPGVTDYQFGMDALEIKYFDPQGGFTNADPADVGHCGAFVI